MHTHLRPSTWLQSASRRFKEASTTLQYVFNQFKTRPKGVVEAYRLHIDFFADLLCQLTNLGRYNTNPRRLNALFKTLQDVQLWHTSVSGRLKHYRVCSMGIKTCPIPRTWSMAIEYGHVPRPSCILYGQRTCSMAREHVPRSSCMLHGQRTWP